MTTKVWLGGVYNPPNTTYGVQDWDAPGNWSPTGVPTAADDVVVGPAAEILADYYQAPPIAHSLTISGPADVSINTPVSIPTINITGAMFASFDTVRDAKLTVDTSSNVEITNLIDTTVTGSVSSFGYIAGAVSFQPSVGLPDAKRVVYLLGAATGPASLDGGYIFLGLQPTSESDKFAPYPGSAIGPGLSSTLTLGPHLTIDLVYTTDVEGASTPADVPSVANQGLLNLTSGALVRLNGYVTNTGTITLTSAQLVVQYANAFGGVIRFADGAGALSLGSSQVNATLSGLRPGDTVDLFNIAFSGAALTTSDNVLGVTENGAVAAQLTLQDHTSLDPNAFTLTPDSTGGTVVRTTTAPTATVAFSDATNSDSGTLALDPAGAGAPAFLQYQYLDTSADSVAMAATVPNVFLKGGSGNKALSASSGTNVLDGGTGGAFLTGGTGQDTFFVDVRSANAFVWDTIANFHQGDVLTMWGFVPGTSATSFSGQQGAVGYTGATLDLDLGGTGATNARVTFTGLSDAQGGNLTTATGTVGGLTYLTLTNLGV